MKLNDVYEEAFWKQVYLASITSGAHYKDAMWEADSAISALRERALQVESIRPN